MADLVKELNNLDFSNYIGGPLQAAVEAQNSASLAAINFIKEVGFKNQSANVTDERATDTENLKVERTYDMSVHVKAVNDEIPAGLDRILKILESEIKDEHNAQLQS